MTSYSSGIRLVAFDEHQKLHGSIRNATIESIVTFHELSPCISFIQEQTKEKTIIILITTTIDENILQSFEALTAIEAILISSTINTGTDMLPSKVFQIYYQQETLLRSLPEILNTIELRINASSYLLNHNVDGSDNLPFYFYHIWKNDTENNNKTKSTKKSLIDQARLMFSSNNQIKACIQNFESSYKPTSTITWLDRQRSPFPYHLLILNALRCHNQEILSLSRFFIDDLTKQMKPATIIPHCKQVFLGTKLSVNLIEKLEQQAKLDILAFQCFIFVTQSRAKALAEATRLLRRRNLVNVLFKIDMNDALCAILGENVIIDMATPFKILCVTKSTGANNSQQLLVIIKLSALNRNQRNQLYEEFIEQQKRLGIKTNDLLRKMTLDISDDETLADEHIARNEWSQAANIFARMTDPNARILNKYGSLLHDNLKNLSDALQCHQQALTKTSGRERAETFVYLGLVYKSMQQHEESAKCYIQALEWFEHEHKRDSEMIARCLVGAGNAYSTLQQLPEALNCLERALAIRENEIKPKDDTNIAICLGNISNILHDQGDIERALSYATRTVEILSKCEKNEIRFAAALNNLGAIHKTNGDFVKARETFQRGLESLPDVNHPHRKSIVANIATIDAIEKLNK